MSARAAAAAAATRVTPAEFLRRNPTATTLSKTRLTAVMVRRGDDTKPFDTKREFDAWFDSDDPAAQKLPA